MKSNSEEFISSIVITPSTLKIHVFKRKKINRNTQGITSRYRTKTITVNFQDANHTTSSEVVVMNRHRELKHRCFWDTDVHRKFNAFSCPTNELQSSHVSIYNLTFSTKREYYASKRRSFDFRLTSVAQKRVCLSSLIIICHVPLIC